MIWLINDLNVISFDYVERWRFVIDRIAFSKRNLNKFNKKSTYNMDGCLT